MRVVTNDACDPGSTKARTGVEIPQYDTDMRTVASRLTPLEGVAIPTVPAKLDALPDSEVVPPLEGVALIDGAVAIWTDCSIGAEIGGVF